MSRAVVQRILNAAGKRDLPALMDLYADEAVAAIPVFGEVRSRPTITATWRRLFERFRITRWKYRTS